MAQQGIFGKEREYLLAVADPRTVAEYIGMPMKKQGKNISILCPHPGHVDHHMGNCFLTDYGYRCYSCGAKENLADMVRQYKDVDYQEALGIIADAYGGRERYQSIKGKVTKGPWVLSKEECKVLGIYNTPVYGVVRIGDSTSDFRTNERVVFSHWEEDKVVYATERRLVVDPLQKLMDEDYTFYKEMVLQHAEDTLVRLREVSQELAKEPTAWFWLQEDMEQIQKIQEILYKHFLIKPENQSERSAGLSIRVKVLAELLNQGLVGQPF